VPPVLLVLPEPAAGVLALRGHPVKASAVRRAEALSVEEGDELADAVLGLLRRIAHGRGPVWPDAPSIFGRGGPLYLGDQETLERVSG